MTYPEIKNHIEKDLYNIEKAIAKRHVMYARERKKKRIGGHKEYIKCYEYTSPNKIKWLIFLFKTNDGYDFKKGKSSNDYLVAYFNTDQGYNCFRILLNEQRSEVLSAQKFNGHVFKRYAERLNLNFVKPIDTVKDFFKCNKLTMPVVNRDTEELINLLESGYCLGVYDRVNKYFINKTFISRDMAHEEQLELRRVFAKEYYTSGEFIQEMMKTNLSEERINEIVKALF